MLVTSTAKAGKIDICHYDQDLDRYFAKTIPASAWGDHQAHGDGMVGDPVPAPHAAGYVFDENCQPVEAGPVETIYAVAYIDVIDDGGGYDPHTDHLIAKLVEASGDGQPGNGDMVITDVYPTAFDAPWNIRSFTTKAHTVTACGSVLPHYIHCVNAGVGVPFIFEHLEGYWEQYSESNTALFDDIGCVPPPIGDFLNINPASPSKPVEWVVVRMQVCGDNAFLDVDIYSLAQN